MVGYLEEGSEFAFSIKARNFFTNWEELVASKTNVYSKCLLKCCPLGCIFYVPTKLAVCVIKQRQCLVLLVNGEVETIWEQADTA